MPVRRASPFLILIVIMLAAARSTPTGPSGSASGPDSEAAGWRWAATEPIDDPRGWRWASIDPAGWRWD
jgi:hypothetical protein